MSSPKDNPPRASTRQRTASASRTTAPKSENGAGAPEHRPRVAFVVQRCGAQVNGGAEALCLQIAQRMARHWDTEVLTTCALDYMTWDNFFPEEEEQIGSTLVRRFRNDQPRDVEAFNRLSSEIQPRQQEATLAEQETWMRSQGPVSTSLLRYLETQQTSYDAFIFFGYLYATSYFGLPLVRSRAFLAPLGHDEWPIYFDMWDELFSLPKGMIFQTPEEREFLARRFPSLPLSGPLAGVGIDRPRQVDPLGFREKYSLKRPFLLYAGRIDASKGCAALFEWFVGRGKAVRDFQLVVTGREVLPVPYDPDIIYLGFVSEEEKWNALAAASWLILPSEYESLSISLLEAWMVECPGLVNAKSEVLRGHCERSNGGVWYSTFEECERLLQLIDDEAKLKLGQQGRDYVLKHYTWDRIESTYCSLLPQGS